MAKRTMSVVEMSARTKYARGEGHQAEVAKLPGGDDMLDLLTEHLEYLQNHPDELRNDVKQRYHIIDNVERVGRTLLVVGGYGTFGEARRRNHNVDTHRPLYTNDDPESAKRDSALTDLRAMFFVPEVGKHVVMFNERSSNHSLGSGILSLFAARWPSWHSDLTLDSGPVIESEAWLKGAELMKVEAKVFGWSTDSADDGTKAVGTLAQTLVPEGVGKVLPHGLYTALTEGKVSKATLLRLPQEPDETRVTLTKDGRTKTFEIQNTGLPAVLYVLAEDGEDVPSDEVFKSECRAYAEEIFQRVGGEWKTGWNRKDSLKGSGGSGEDSGSRDRHKTLRHLRRRPKDDSQGQAEA